MSTEQQVEEGVHALLASLEQSTETSERRRHPRSCAPGHIPATLRRQGSGTVRGSVKDLSRSGAGVYSQTPIETGEQVEVTIEPPGRPAIRATCRVVSCRLEPSGRHVIGLEFVQIARASEPRPQSPAPASLPAEEATTPDDHLAAVNDRLRAALTAN